MMKLELVWERGAHIRSSPLPAMMAIAMKKKMLQMLKRRREGTKPRKQAQFTAESAHSLTVVPDLADIPIRLVRKVRTATVGFQRSRNWKEGTGHFTIGIMIFRFMMAISVLPNWLHLVPSSILCPSGSWSFSSPHRLLSTDRYHASLQ